MTRASWDATWIAVAEAMAWRSRCTGRQIGAVIVDKHNRPIAVGYNGPPANWDGAITSDCSGWCPRMKTGERTASYDNCISVHAEANALLFADRREYEGGTIYITSAACWDCGKLIANSGLKHVVMKVADADNHRYPAKTINMLMDCRIDVRIW